ncbi:hypothetical protein N9B73_01115 [Verrucomicrobiales bacterium]|jgi:uncharacterized membrane protein|nr:hypothetical protein [Verrucomicrobiales bacterium]
MKDFFRFLYLLPVVGSLWVASVSEVAAQGPPKGPPTALDEGEAKLWGSLSEEEREELKQALREVWSDPTVISARAEVQQSSEAYHKAVMAAISRADPSAAKVLSKLQALSRGLPDRKGDRRGPGFRLSPRGERPIGESMGFPAALGDFSDEERSRFREVENEAKESPAVKKVIAELEASREKDDEVRKSKLDLYRKLRTTVLAEMVEIDPRVEELVAKLRPGPRESGVRPDGGKGKGRPVRKDGKKRPESE